MNQSSIRDLRDAAERATPGPWQVVWDIEGGDFGAVLGRELRGVEGPVDPEDENPRPRWIVRFDDDYGHDIEPDAAYIAAASPDVVLRLLNALDDVRRRIADRKCENFHLNNCAAAGRDIDSPYGAEGFCDPCIARAALSALNDLGPTDG